MLDHKQKMIELLKKVEAGGEDTPDFHDLVSSPLMQCKAEEAYRGSIDAAEELHEALLPRWNYSDYLTRGLRYTAYIAKSIEDESICAVSNCPARVRLIAILKALIKKETKENA